MHSTPCMLTTPRIVMGALAALFLPTLACEIDVPATDASSYGGTAATTTSGDASRAFVAPKAPAETTADADPMPVSTLGSSQEVSNDDSLADPRPPLRAFAAGGETRFLCPSRYRPRAAEGGCACVSSTDGLTEYPLGDAPCGDGVGRAEGSECVFTCPARNE